MIGSLNSEFGFLQQTMNLRAYRQQVLASNVANADTPNYKARDFDFAAELRRAESGRGGKLPLAASSERHLSASRDNPLGAQLLYRNSVQPSIDGNTVDMDLERSQFTDNAIHYQFALDRVIGKAKTLMSAIQGQ